MWGENKIVIRDSLPVEKRQALLIALLFVGNNDGF
jgi:hypothetical protein